jgi:hypothetical protein
LEALNLADLDDAPIIWGNDPSSVRAAPSRVLSGQNAKSKLLPDFSKIGATINLVVFNFTVDLSITISPSFIAAETCSLTFTIESRIAFLVASIGVPTVIINTRLVVALGISGENVNVPRSMFRASKSSSFGSQKKLFFSRNEFNTKSRISTPWTWKPNSDK